MCFTTTFMRILYINCSWKFPSINPYLSLHTTVSVQMVLKHKDQLL